MALFNVVQLDVVIVVVAVLLAGVLLDALVVERPQAAETLMWSIAPAGPSLLDRGRAFVIGGHLQVGVALGDS